MTVPVKPFGEQIRGVRARRGHSLKTAAALVDGAVTHATISRVENGLRDPQLATLLALARAYDVDIVVKRTGEVVIHGTGIRAIEDT